MATYDVNALLSSTAYGSDGDKIGKIEQVFLDDNTEEVTFVTVNTGLFGTKESFVPVEDARQDGDRLVLPYTKDVVKDAPNVDADQHLSPAEEEEIYRYYKMNYAGTDTDRSETTDYAGTDTDRGLTDRSDTTDYVGTGTTGRNDQDTLGTDRNAVPGGGLAGGTAGVAGGTATGAETGRDVSGTAGYAETDRDRDTTDASSTAGIAESGRITDPDLTDPDRTDNGVVRHEERPNADKEREEAGRARLRRYVVTEHGTGGTTGEDDADRRDRT